MKGKKAILYLIMVLSMLSVVYGACVVPTIGMTITATANNTFCTGTYQLNNGGDSAMLTVVEDSVNVNLNGSTFKGDGTGYLFYSGAYEQIQYFDGTITNFTTGINHQNTVGARFINITNITFANNTYAVFLSRNGHVIRDCYFTDCVSDCIRGNGQGADGIYVLDSTFNGASNTQDMIHLEGTAEDWVIDNNIFANKTLGSIKHGIYFSEAHHINITNNIFENGHLPIENDDTSTYDNYVVNNTFYNIFDENGDAYSPIHTFNEENSTYRNNSFDVYRNNFFDDSKNIVFEGNIYPSGDSKFAMAGSNENFVINESSTTTNVSLATTGTWFDYDSNKEIVVNDRENLTRICPSDNQQYTIASGEDWVFNECSAGCEFVADDTSLSGAFLICKGTYYLYDTSNDGILQPSGATNLDCNGTVLNGDGSGYALYSSNSDINMINCNFNNYNRAVGWFSDDFSLINSTISNCTDVMKGNGGDDNLILSGNTFIDNTDIVDSGTTTRNITINNNNIYNSGRIFFNSGTDNLTINNNNFYTFDGNAILVSTSSKDINIYSNYIQHTDGIDEVIRLNGINDSNIYNNEIILGGRGIYTNDNCRRLSVYGNTLNQTNYSITIDTTHDSLIYDNNMFLESYFGSSHGLMITYDSINNTGYRNNITNYQFGLLFEYGSYDNTFYDNIVDDTVISLYELHNTKTNYAYNNTLGCKESGDYAGIYIFDNVTSSRYFDNTLSCGIDIKLDDVINNISFNNKDKSSYNINIESNDVTNITINETSTNYHKFTLSNSAVIKLDGNYRKDLTVTNNTYTINSVPAINVYCNSTTATCSDNTGAYSETLGVSTLSYLLRLATATDPKPSSMATTVTDFDYSYSSTDKRLTIGTTGSGEIALLGMNNLGNSDGFFSVFKESIEQDTIFNTDTYTMTQVANWLFIPAIYSSQQCNAIKNNFENVFYPIFGILGLFIFVIIVALVNSKINDSYSSGTHFYKILAGAMLLVVFTVSIAVIILKIIVSVC